MKKNNIKYIIAGLVISSGLFFAACSDYFDQQPQGKWIEGDGGGSFQSEVFGLYAKLRGFHVTTGNTALAIHSMRSEDAEKGSTFTDGTVTENMFDNFFYVSDNGMLKSYWEENYTIVRISNKVIDEINDLHNNGGILLKEDTINLGEAHFCRAFAYFNLVRAFGEVPKLDFKVVEGTEEVNLPKSPVADIYGLVDKDLTLATKYLPRKWDPVFVGRLTWGAARSLHAKAYLTRNDWTNTHAAAKDVVNSGLYDLSTPYDKIFRETGENCSESIFELQCTASEEKPGSNEVGSQFAMIQGVRGANAWNLGWGQNTPSDLLANAFEPGDPRKDETLLYFYKTEAEAAAGTIVNMPWGEKPVASTDAKAKYYNKKAYTDPTLRAKYTKFGYWVNVRMIRLSDVLLMGAEAANELGLTDEALDYLERVRFRARGGNQTILPEVTDRDQTILRDKIRHERRVELGMEFDRFYDLVRWGIAEDVLHAAGKTNYSAKHRYLPLPKAVVDSSNGVLVQNPDYN